MFSGSFPSILLPWNNWLSISVKTQISFSCKDKIPKNYCLKYLPVEKIPTTLYVLPREKRSCRQETFLQTALLQASSTEVQARSCILNFCSRSEKSATVSAIASVRGEAELRKGAKIDRLSDQWRSIKSVSITQPDTLFRKIEVNVPFKE